MIQIIERLPSLLVFKKAVNYLRVQLNSSNHAKALNNVNFSLVIQGQGIPDKDWQWLCQLANVLYSQKEKYQSSLAVYEADSDQNIFATKFSELLLALVGNFEILLLAFKDLQVHEQLYELLMMTTKAKNLQIAFNVAMFWREFKESIFQVEVNSDAI